MENSNKNWVLQIDPAVLKTLKKFPQKDAKRIFTVIRQGVIFENPEREAGLKFTRVL